MPFQKGRAKTGGMVTGQRTRRTLSMKKLNETWQEMGFSLEERLAEELTKDEPYVELIEAMIKLLPYVTYKYKDQDPPPEPLETTGTEVASLPTNELTQALTEPKNPV